MSWMPTWGWVVGSTLAYIAVWRYAFREAVDRAPVKDWADLAIALGFMFVIAIPAAVWFLLLRGESEPMNVARRLGGETKRQKRKRQEERVAELEKELGL